MKSFDFNKVAQSYDDFYKTEYGRKVDQAEKSVVRKYLNKLRVFGKTLEIGCGTGHWTSFLVKEGFRINAIDKSEEMIRVAQAKKIPHVSWGVQSIESLNFESESFDNVVAFTSLEFIEDLDATFLEISRVLKNGGHFLVGALNENSHLGNMQSEHSIFKHARLFNQRTLFEFLEQFGSPHIEDCCFLTAEKNLVKRRTDLKEEGMEGAFLLGYVRKSV